MESNETLISSDLRNVSCVEVLQACRELDVPLSLNLTLALELPESDATLMGKQRYGSPFAQASGIVLRSASLYGPASADVHERIFGIDTTKAWEDVSAYVSATHGELSDSEREELILMEMAEVTQSPNSFYRLDLLKLNHQFKSEGARLLWKAMQSAAGLENSSNVPQFQCTRERSVTWGNCKDSEHYLAATLKGTGTRLHYGARGCVFVDSNNEPVIYQKIGEYNIHVPNSKSDFNNATGLTLTEISVNGIVIPAGTLVGVDSSLTGEEMKQPEDRIVSVNNISSVFPLRYSLFALNPTDAQTSFSHQYSEFVRNSRNGLVTLDSFKDTAKMILEG